MIDAVALAPPPDNVTPNPSDCAEATADVSMVADSAASMLRFPEVVVIDADVACASTVLAIVLDARDALTETAAPTPTAAAKVAAFAFAVIFEVSWALMVTPLLAWTPELRVFDTAARTRVLTWFSSTTPAPEAATAMSPTLSEWPSACTSAVMAALSAAVSQICPAFARALELDR